MNNNFNNGYIIVKSVRQGNEYIRSLNKKNPPAITSQWEAVTLEKLAEDVIRNDLYSQGEKLPVISLMSPTEEALVMKQVIEADKCYKDYLPESSRSFATYQSLTEAVQTIRLGQTTSDWDKLSEDDPFKKIVRDFESECVRLSEEKENHRFDRVGLFSSALKAINEDYKLKQYYRTCYDYGISTTRKESMTWLEREFYDELTNLPDEKSDFITMVDDWYQNAGFFSAYGHTEEVKKVCDQIVKKKINPSDTVIYYTSEVYEPVLHSILSEAGIRHAFLSGRSVYTTETGRGLAAILKWAENGFVYGDLKDVFDSRFVRIPNPMKGKGNESDSLSLINVFLKNTGAWGEMAGFTWGYKEYKRIVTYFRNKAEEYNEKKNLETEETEKNNLEKQITQYNGIAEVLEQLIHCFYEQNDKPIISYSSVFRSLAAFMHRYDKVFTDDMKREWGVLSPTFYDAAGMMELMGEASSTEELAHTMRDMVGRLQIKGEVKDDGITLIRLDGNTPDLTGRNNAFFIGLSKNDMRGRTEESPFLSDDNRHKYLDSSKGKVVTAASDTQERTEAFRTTVKQKKWGNVFISYSDFDTVEVKESAPAVIYMDLKKEAGKEKS